MHLLSRPVWAEINLDSLKCNIQAVRKQLPLPKEIIAVVKANAYGHGAVRIAKAAIGAGASRLAVAILDEAVELRRAGIEEPILVMGYTPSAQGGIAASLQVALAVFDESNILGLAAAAQNTDFPLVLHLKVDTGMGRLGVGYQEAVALAKFASNRPGCILEGIFTHLAAADTDAAYTQLQIKRFKGVLADLERAAIDIPVVHGANSAAILSYPAGYFSAVRLGLAMYGLSPFPEADKFMMRPLMTLKARVSQAKWLTAGSPVGYGQHYVTKRDTYLITLPFGYADGYPRSLSNKGAVWVRGQELPLVGDICMDQCMADATALPHIQRDDEVIIWGGPIPAARVARLADTIVYETVAALSNRVPRFYVEGRDFGINRGAR